MDLQELTVHFLNYSQIQPSKTMVLQSWGDLCRIKHLSQLWFLSFPSLGDLLPCSPSCNILLQQLWEVWEKKHSCGVDRDSREASLEMQERIMASLLRQRLFQCHLYQGNFCGKPICKSENM